MLLVSRVFPRFLPWAIIPAALALGCGPDRDHREGTDGSSYAGNGSLDVTGGSGGNTGGADSQVPSGGGGALDGGGGALDGGGGALDGGGGATDGGSGAIDGGRGATNGGGGPTEDPRLRVRVFGGATPSPLGTLAEKENVYLVVSPVTNQEASGYRPVDAEGNPILSVEFTAKLGHATSAPPTPPPTDAPPAAYVDLETPPGVSDAPTPVVGEVQSLDFNGPYEAVCVAVSPHGYVLIDQAVIADPSNPNNEGKAPGPHNFDAAAEAILQGLENEVYPIAAALAGPPPQGDRVRIVLHERFRPGIGGVAGGGTVNLHSPGLPENTGGIVSTLAHEYLHYLLSKRRHGNKAPGERSWLNETWAQTSSTLHFRATTAPGEYEKSVERGDKNAAEKGTNTLTCDAGSYGTWAIFGRYVHDRFGVDSIYRQINGQGVGMAGVASAVGLPFNEVFGDWVVATLLGVQNVATDDPRYRSYWTNPKTPPAELEVWDCDSDEIHSLDLMPYAVEFRRIGNPTSNCTITLSNHSVRGWLVAF